MCLMITPKETQEEGSIANFDADHLLHLFTAPTAELALSIPLCGQITSPLQRKTRALNPTLLIHRSLPRELIVCL